MNTKLKWLMALSLAAMAWTGCAEEDSNSCGDAETRTAQSRVAAEMAGVISLVFEGQKIPVDVSLSTTTTGCAMDVVLTQTTNSACGVNFEGTLEYNKAATPPAWEGELFGDFAEDKFNTRVVISLHSPAANVVRVNADIVEAIDVLCKDRTLTGDVRPR